ncbi:hypothetical protein [Streptomyces sp. NPDC005907]|uniref:hypothetical protein n=1 Tax=Streptomyces sp. NPDC005907 TaxID=3154571 RepID=UPI0033C39B03
MSEYTAVCNASSRDVIGARIDGDSVELAARSYGEHKMETYLDPTKARTFARGILALADEIDGGEAKPADTRPKVGDKLLVLEDHPRHCPVVKGDVITVAGTDYDHDGTDCVRFYHEGDTYAWFIPLTAVEPADPAVPAPAPKVGDRVRVTLDDDVVRTGEYVGKVGVLLRDHGAGPGNRYKVQFGDGSGPHGDKVNGTWCVRDVEVDDEPTPTEAAPEQSAHARFIEEAKALLSDVEYDAASLATVAQFLADGE